MWVASRTPTHGSSSTALPFGEGCFARHDLHRGDGWGSHPASFFNEGSTAGMGGPPSAMTGRSFVFTVAGYVWCPTLAPLPRIPQAILSSLGCAIMYAMRTAPSVSIISMAKEYGYSATDKGQVRGGQ